MRGDSALKLMRIGGLLMVLVGLILMALLGSMPYVGGFYIVIGLIIIVGGFFIAWRAGKAIRRYRVLARRRGEEEQI